MAIQTRTTFTPPAVDPADPPTNISTMMKAFAAKGQTSQSKVANPVVVCCETTVNVAALNGFDAGTEVTPDLLAERGMIRKATDKVKILGNGDLTVSVSLKIHKISQSAADKVSAAGGSYEVIGG